MKTLLVLALLAATMIFAGCQSTSPPGSVGWELAHKDSE